MSPSESADRSSHDPEADQLAAIVDQYDALVQAGQPVDIGQLAAQLPGKELMVREVLQCLQLVRNCHPESQSDGTELPPVIGDFEIIEEVGRGGMGIVYRARQRSLDRIVALKVLPLAASLDRKCLERFRIETHSASILQHPNIVSIYGTGCQQGVHYYAMQFVTGLSLQEHLRAGHVAEIRQAVLWAQAVACGLQHAHELGVVHRDVKPSNLLVDETGKIWITDFGLAQMDEQNTLTLTGDLVGTLRYMSPEQATGNGPPVDHRTDIYSLGTTLYEMLFQRPMIPGSGRIEILKNVLEVDARFPRDARPIPRDLRTIIRKATAKDRDYRYDSAAALANDLQRLLDNRPILATRPKLGQRLSKWVMRNPVASVCLVLAPLFILMVMGLYNISIAAQKREVERALRTAMDNERIAQRETQKARTVSELLQQMVASANPDQTKGADYSVRQLLDDLSAQLFQQLDDQPEVAASLHSTIGNAYRRLGAPERALSHLQTAMKLHQPEPTERRVLAQNHVDLAWNFAALGDYDSGIQYAQQAIQLNGRAPTREAIQAQWCLQHCLIYDSQFSQADSVAETAIELARAIDPNPPEMANILHDLAQSKTRQGKPKEAIDFALQAIHLHQQLHGQHHPETGWGFDALGRAYLAVGQATEARDCFEKALSIFELNYPLQHKSIRLTLEQLELAVRAQGTQADLLSVQQRRERNVLGHLLVKKDANETSLLGFLDKKGNYLAAGELVMAAPEVFESWEDLITSLQLLQNFRWQVLDDWGALTTIQARRWQTVYNMLLDRAETVVNSAQTSPISPASLNTLAWLATICDATQARRPQQAVQWAERATQIDPQVGAYWNTLGLAYLRAGRAADAVVALRRSQTFETTDEYDTVLLAMAFSQLGQLTEAKENLAVTKSQYSQKKSKNREFARLLWEAEAAVDQLTAANQASPGL